MVYHNTKHKYRQSFCLMTVYNYCVSHTLNSGACRKNGKEEAVLHCWHGKFMCFWDYAKAVGVKITVSEGIIYCIFL